MRTLISVFTFIFICTYQTSAQDFLISRQSGIGPKLGYYKAPDAEDGTMFFGAQTRFRGEFVGLEIAAEYRGSQEYTTTGGELTIQQVPVTASLMGFIPVSDHVNPYALGGLGAYYTFYDYEGGFVEPGDETEMKIGYHLGFGAEFPLHSSAAINVDYRYLFLDGDDNLQNKEFSGNVFSAGVTLYF